MNHIPGYAIVNNRIAMYQLIAEIDNAAALANSKSECWVEFGETIHSLANNLKLALNGGSHHGVVLIVGESSAASKLTDEIDGLLNVIKNRLAFNLHTAVALCGSLTAESMDS